MLAEDGIKRSLRAPRGVPPARSIADGVNALASWTTEHADEFKVIAQRRDADGAMVDRALEIVRKFIVERQLILFGGLAIDYALRLRGSRIYPDDQRPDFDFMSMRSVDDAYDLADILQRAGFESVRAVRGIHVQTMRVGTNFVWVADIGYAPPDVFADIPTFDFQGMRVVHPNYQRMDLHLAFCFPFNGPPREDVFNRWRKDLKRFNLIEAHYPYPGERRDADGAPRRDADGAPRRDADGAPRMVVGKFAAPVSGKQAQLKGALHGFAAYAALRATLDVLAEKMGVAPPAVAAPRLKLEFADDFTVSVEMPAGDAVVVATPWPEDVTPGFEDTAQRYRPYMDVYPESYSAPGVAVVSTKGRLLATALVRLGSRQAYVVTPQYLLMWLLFSAHRASSEAPSGASSEAPSGRSDAAAQQRAIFENYYAHVMEIITTAEQIFAAAVDSATGDSEIAAAVACFGRSPFAPTTETIGTVNNDAAYVIKIAGNAARMQDTPPAVLNVEADVATMLVGLPANYYPAKTKQRPTFSYDASVLFQRSGQMWAR